MNRPTNLRALWLLGALALATGFLSCQSGSTDATEPVPTSERTQVVVVYSIKKSEPFKVADSLTWATATQSGSGLIPRPSDSNDTYRSFAASIQLKTPLKDGALILSLWSHGVRFLQARFQATGATDTLQLVSALPKSDVLALTLLQGLDSLKSSVPQTRDGLLNLYGTWILASDARIQGFPDSLPVGISATEAIQATLVAASKSGKTLIEQAKTWSLGITTDSATSIALKLIQTKKIAAKDSSALFPPPPIRPTTPISVGSGLRAGSVSVGVTGAFEWDEGLGLVVFQGSISRDGVPDTNLVVYGLPAPRNTDRAAKFDGSVNVLAKASAPEGTYVLTITLQDGAQHKAVSSASFQVAAKLADQPAAPRIRLLAPADKSTVPFETTEVVTSWIAATPQGSVESVKVEGVTADKVNDSTWQAKVRLEPTGKTRTVVGKVVNSAGLEAVATLDLTRQADLTGPVITWISPTADLEVENGVTSITVRVKATDPSGIDTVLIAGSKPDSLTSTGEYIRKVPLTVVGSPQTILVRVVDSAKNPTVSSKSITRANPATDVPPKTVLLDPTSKTGTTVPFETKSVTVRWTITDPYGIDSASVMINGKPAKSEGSDKWSAVVDLVAGSPTPILLSVKNKNGVSGGDVASVTRKADTTAPHLEWIAGGRSVGFDSSEVVVSGNASDNDSLVSVTIGGLIAPGSNDAYSVKLKLEVGDNPVVAVATDRTGLKDTIRTVVHRYQKLSITRIDHSLADTTLGAGVGSVVLSWKVVGAKSVGVGDSTLSRTGDLYTWTANLSGASTHVALWALDSAGKRDSSEVTVIRRGVAALSLRYGIDTALTMPDSVVIAATSEPGATLAWSLDGTTWTAFIGSFVQKVTGTAQVRARVAGKDDAIASLKAHSLYHLNHAPTIALTSTGLLVKSYVGTFSANVVKLTDWGAGDGVQSGAWEVQQNSLADTQFVSGLSIDESGKLTGSIRQDTSMTVKVRLRLHDDGGTTLGGVNLSSWTEWFPIQVVDTVQDGQGGVYRARRMPDGHAWMRENLRTTANSADTGWIGGAAKNGRSYFWSQAMGLDSGCDTSTCKVGSKKQGICPTGWHVSDTADWGMLIRSLAGSGGISGAFSKLRADTGWRYYGGTNMGSQPPTIYSASDDFGMGIYPSQKWKYSFTTAGSGSAGSSVYGSFTSTGVAFWTSSGLMTFLNSIGILHLSTNPIDSYEYFSNGAAVRCVMN